MVVCQKLGTSTTLDKLTRLCAYEDKVEVTSASSDLPYVTAELSTSKYEELAAYVVTAALKPGAPIGELKGTITINSDQPEIRAPVYAYVEEP